MIKRIIILLLSIIMLSCIPMPEIATIIANTAYDQGKQSSAVESYMKVFNISKDNLIPSYNLGTCFLSMAEYDSARQLLKDSLKSNDKVVAFNSNYNLSVLELYAENWQSAYEYAVNALKINGKSLQAKKNLEIALSNIAKKKEKSNSELIETNFTDSTIRNNSVYNIIKELENNNWLSNINSNETDVQENDY